MNTLSVDFWGQRSRSEYDRPCVKVSRSDFRLCNDSSGQRNSNAVLRGDLKATQEALKSDPKKIASLDSDGNSPLHLACEKGNKELIDVLLLAGADVNAINSKKATALHRLISSPDDNPAAIGILFSKAAAIEAKNSDNETALFMACRLDKVKTARFLVERG